ncbi:MAG: DUF4131 domain-containing protein [Verrucomicrobia bacterium]|nr:MAG: DUF4131 domain-containing protein [Verrucomicrobiota bacterium]TAE88445.1 MAG: DUF4131 domain-containing protein [Verrucomicrobiota bacterium]TAF26900.1 MAG: DUF4131 domain-containing protein [Verrucomicrobiota bacterium]TAF42156.1 MAG: DUF4131 domain-containing protein [Verrucomicrobiota bacterium]
MIAWLRRSVERHPLLWVAAVAACAVLAVDGSPLVGALLAALPLILLLKLGRVGIAATALFFAALAGLLHGIRLGPQQVARQKIEATGSRHASTLAQVLSSPQASGGGWSALVDLRGDGPRGKVWWWGRGHAAEQGSIIQAEGRFLPPPPPRNPGEFDVPRWLHRQGAWAVFEARGPARTIEAPSTIARLTTRIRTWFRDAVTAGLDPTGPDAAVIRAMVLGENPDDDALIEAYRASGTLHVFSVSGMHVAMVGAIGWLVLRLLSVPRRQAVWLILAGMFTYAWISGMKAPAARSVTMAAILLGAFLLRRRPDLLNALGFALLAALLLDGHLIFQPGVQLSFGVLTAIGLATAAATRLFAWLKRREPYLPLPLYGPWRSRWLKLRENIATSLGASTAASLGSLPLTGWHFGFFSPVSIFASPLIGLPVFALMALALLAAALSPLPALREKINLLNGRVASTCTGIATRAAEVPGASFGIPRDRPGPHFLVVYDIRHGGGGACLHDAGLTLLLDTGHRPGFRRTLLPSLRHFALRPQSMALSHPDGDHLGGGTDALDAFPVRQILLPVARARSEGFRSLQEAAIQRGISVVHGTAGESYPISPSACLEVLHQPDPLDWHAVADERVMVLRLHWRGWRILFLSDAGLRTERALLESGRDLRADLIVAGRHRHDASLGDDFLAAVKPRAIIASHADFPPEENIPASWQAACEHAGIRIFHQGRCGAVTLVPESDGTLRIRGFLDASELRLTH